MSNSLLFVGYNNRNHWLASIDPGQPVFANLYTEHGETNEYHQRIDKLVIMLAQPEADLVHYCRFVVGELNFISGEVFDADHKKRISAANAKWDKVLDWLQSLGLVYRLGLVAAPKHLHFLECDDIP